MQQIFGSSWLVAACSFVLNMPADQPPASALSTTRHPLLGVDARQHRGLPRPARARRLNISLPVRNLTAIAGTRAAGTLRSHWYAMPGFPDGGAPANFGGAAAHPGRPRGVINKTCWPTARSSTSLDQLPAVSVALAVTDLRANTQRGIPPASVRVGGAGRRRLACLKKGPQYEFIEKRVRPGTRPKGVRTAGLAAAAVGALASTGCWSSAMLLSAFEFYSVSAEISAAYSDWHVRDRARLRAMPRAVCCSSVTATCKQFWAAVESLTLENARPRHTVIFKRERMRAGARYRASRYGCARLLTRPSPWLASRRFRR